MPVGNGTRLPFLKQVATHSPSRSLDDASILSGSSSHEQDQASSFSNATHDSTGSPQMSGGDIKGDDVDSLSDTENIP